MKKICQTCKKEIKEGDEVKMNEWNDWVFHQECLEKEYEYARDKGLL